MPNIFQKLKNRFTSAPAKSKSTGDINLGASTSSLAGSSSIQCYTVKDKDLPKLHYAAWKGNLDKVTELCRPDKLNSIDKEGRTPLHLAVAANHLAVTQHLLTEDAKLQVFDKDNRSPLILAVQNGSIKMMELLISYLDQKNLINIPDRNGLTCLFYAIKVQNGVQILKLLFQKNLVNKSQSDKEKNTALHFAIIQKNYDAIVVLLENGLDIDARNTDGRTPLMLAALSGDEKLTEYFLENGADLSIKDKSGQTAVDLSKKSRNEKCIALLQQNRYSGRTQSEDRVDTETDSANILKGEKKFEGLFAKKNASPNKSEGNLATSRAASSLNKYKIEDDESQATEEKIVLSHDRSEKGNTWTNSDEEDDDDDDDDEEEGVSSAPKSEKEYANMFSSIKKEKQENKQEDFDPIATGESFVISKAENEEEEEQEDEEDWPEMPSTASIQRNITSNKPAQPTFSTFFPTSKSNKDTDESTDGVANWSIFVITGTVKNAGTDANVYIQIFGSRCASAQMVLDRKFGNKKLFEAGNCDKFDRNLPDIGKPLKIKIGHDNKGIFAGWFLDKVVLQNNITNEKYLFKCERWLSKDEQDHKIELELNVENANNETKTKQQQRTESSSSWNSSGDEDEDSLSAEVSSKKNIVATPRNSNILKIIDEEKLLNDTKESNKSEFFLSKNESVSKVKKDDVIIMQGPPEISDFEDSTEDEIKKRSINNSPLKITTMQSQKSPSKVSQEQGTLSALARAFTPKETESPKKKETISQLFDNKKASFDLSDVDEKSLSIDALIDSAENMFDENKKNETIKNLFKNNDSNSPVKSNESSPIKNYNNNTIKQTSVLIDQFKTRSFGFEDDNKSESIGDLIATVDNILEKPKPKNDQMGLSGMIKSELKNNPNNFLSNSPQKVEQMGLSGMIKSELKNNPNNFLSNSPQKADQMGLSGMIKSELKNNPNNFLSNSPAHSQTNITQTTSSQNNPNTSSSSNQTPSLTNLLRNEIQQSRAKQIAQLDAEENQIQEIELTNLNEQNKNASSFSIFKQENSPIKQSKFQLSNTSKKTSFNDSDDDFIQEDDEDEDFDAQFEFNKQNSSKVSGTIGTAIGSIIGSSSNNKFYKIQNTKQKTSFANIAVELYDKSDANEKNSKSLEMNSFSNNENLKSKLLELDQIKQLLDEMRKKNNELSNEKQQLEIKLSETESKKKTYEQICNEKEKQLAEKENLIFELSTHKQKTEMASRFETNDNKLLQKEIKELREKNYDLESKLNASRVAGIMASTESVSQSSQNFLRVSDDLAQQPILVSQNESLTVRVKALEAQIEELNKDREKLIIYRDELTIQLNEKENDVANQNEALKRASYQYLIEKNALTEENTKAKNELNQMNEAKERLVNELEAIRTELSDKKLKYEQLSMTRLDLEQKLDRETGEHERHLRSCDSEMRSVKEQLVKLNEKLSLKETNLISTENDLKYTKMQIDERQKQIIELKEELSKSKSDFALHLELFRKEKEEKENLLKKCDALEESIKTNIEEVNFWKKKHQRTITNEQNQTGSTGLAVSFAMNQDDDPSFAIEIENKRLQNDVKLLNEKLEKAEKELVDLRAENENMKEHVSRSSKKSGSKRRKSHSTKSAYRNADSNKKDKKPLKDSSGSSDSLSQSTSSIDTAKLKSELKNLKNDFKTIMSKYESNDSQNTQNNTSNMPKSFQGNTNQTSNYQTNNQTSNRPRENIDIPGLITDIPLSSVANLNNYLIKNIIKQESEPDVNNNVHIIPSVNYRTSFVSTSSHDPTTHLIYTRKNTMYATSTDVPSVTDLIPTHECERCYKKSKSYIDALKYELSKRIEFEASKDVPLTESFENYHSNSTSNFDSLYNKLCENSSTSRLLSTQNNNDLINNLRLKFLI